MSFKKWKFGLFVAAITGLLTALAAGQIFPEATWKQLALVLGGSIAKDVLLFLQQNPADKVAVDPVSTQPQPEKTTQ